jgi:hypothetical protein
MIAATVTSSQNPTVDATIPPHQSVSPLHPPRHTLRPAFHLADTAGEPPVRIHSPVPDSKANLRWPAPGAQSPPACVTKAPKWTRYTRRDLLQPGEARCRSAPRCRRRNLDANVGLGTQGKWCGSVKECKDTWVTYVCMEMTSAIGRYACLMYRWLSIA